MNAANSKRTRRALPAIVRRYALELQRASRSGERCWRRRRQRAAHLETPPADGTSPRSRRRFVPWRPSENALRSRFDDVLVGDGALLVLRRDEGNGRVLLAEVPLLS